jgi:hypothetical protein
MREVLKKMDERVGPTSPLPYMIKMRKTIYGKEHPDALIQVHFFILFPITIYFSIWHLMSLFAFSSREFILEQKRIDILELAEERALDIGVDPTRILEDLQVFHSISAILWGVCFFGLIFLWRKKGIFLFFSGLAFLLLIGMVVFYLGGDYLSKEYTKVDKVLLALVPFALLLIYRLRFWSKKEVEVDEDEGEEETENTFTT